MSKTFWAVIAIIVVVFGGILFFKNNKAGAPTNSSGQPTNHVIGNSPSGVTLVEYGDYQCPYCGQFYPIVKQVQQKYNDTVVFQLRNLPLSQVHKNAFAAARAAEASGLQNKYWEMHDVLYQNQNAWSESSNATSYFEQYATGLGLNVTQFKADSASSKVNDLINADISTFLKTGNEESTPTFLLDGKKITPGYSVETFSKYIDAELKAKQAK
jgi:protein-disulfide isomerase